jgi:hypothetical protein
MKGNIKFFVNGSMQITGCKRVSTVVWAIDHIFRQLREFIPDDALEGHMRYGEPYPFVDIIHITDFKIAMINSNFDAGFNVDREKLFNMLKERDYECMYDPSRHAPVNLRFKSSLITDARPTKSTRDSNRIITSSIFIFDGGSIMITGARNYCQIMEGYTFINIFLIENYPKLVKVLIN